MSSSRFGSRFVLSSLILSAAVLSTLLLVVAVGSACASTTADKNNNNEAQAPPTETILGIDLGTTFSAVGVWNRNTRSVEIIPNEMGSRITPSIVAFTDSERLVGDGARNQMPENPTNTISAVKRLMGRQFKDSTVQRDAKLLSYKILPQKKGDTASAPVVSVMYKGERRSFSAEEVSAMVLQKMKQIAESYLGKNVSKAVVTVPAYFNDAQRQTTKDAGTIAGLNVVRIINEPTAAALAYGLDKAEEKNILVYDLGGGTFDVSILTIDDRFFDVLSTNGDTHLGGEDFDNSLVQHFTELIKKKHGKDIKNDAKALARLRKACEAAKRQLSSQLQVSVEVDSLLPGFDLSEKITRAKFEELNMALFKRTLEPVKNALNDAKLKKNEIDEIVLVGGSTRIPKVKQLLQDFFNGKEPNTGINPDEAVAYGAALQAAVLAGEDVNMVVVDVVSLSLGIETVGGVMTKIVERNTDVPLQKKQTFSTYQDDQEAVTIKIFQGERAMTKDNRLLGTFELTGIRKARRGEPQIEVTFDVDENAILTVSAQDKSSGKEEKLTISDERRFTQEEIDRLLKEAEAAGEEDKATRERIEARNQLEATTYSIRSQVKEGSGSQLSKEISEDDRETVMAAVNEAMSVLDDSNSDTLEKSELDAAREKLQETTRPVLARYSSSGSNPTNQDADEDSNEEATNDL